LCLVPGDQALNCCMLHTVVGRASIYLSRLYASSFSIVIFD